MHLASQNQRAYTCWQCIARHGDRATLQRASRKCSSPSIRLQQRGYHVSRHSTTQHGQLGTAQNGDSQSTGRRLQRAAVFQCSSSLSSLTPGNARRFATATSPSSTVLLDDLTTPPLFPNKWEETQRSPETHGTDVRTRMREWQRQHGEVKDQALAGLFAYDPSNPFANVGSRSVPLDAEMENEEYVSSNNLAYDEAELLDSLDHDHRFLRPGDLVELTTRDSDLDPTIAVYVRRVDRSCQYFTSNGKWVHGFMMNAAHVIPGFIDRHLVEQLIPHLPTVIDPIFRTIGQTYDLSVPREVSGPIVSRLSNFVNEVQEIYRKHASTLDVAHNLLADKRNLRFGTITQITRQLLDKKAEDEVSVVEVSATRLALHRSGFGFGFDKRSHRQTGFVNIRSRSRLKMVNNVVEWIRQYREHLSGQHGKDVPDGAQIIMDFLTKASAAIDKSRMDRVPTVHGSLGPSKERLPLDRKWGCFKPEFGAEWTRAETDIIRFVECWAVQGGFSNHHRADAQSQILLQATGRYEDFDLSEREGFLFLQEIGALKPWENRSVYDEHLLLPVSQHSKPLEQLMSKLEVDASAAAARGLWDGMEDLRHDWGQLPVFCIDQTGAREIDDGVSIEPSSDDGGGCWVHIHVADPCAFLKKDDAASSMARHMTETVYMPERAHLMLPPALTQNLFSLGPGRACLTFSAKLDKHGQIQDLAIRAGRINNVKFLDPTTVDEALGIARSSHRNLRITVGGTPPELRDPMQHSGAVLDDAEKDMLRNLLEASRARFELRSSNAGINVGRLEVDVKVWQCEDQPGLLPSSPTRGRVQHTIGDPVIQLATTQYTDGMDLSGAMDAKAMVRECMLLACEVAGKWSSERKVPIIFRGSLPVLPGTAPDAAAAFHERVLVPEMQKNGGKVPLHLIYSYLEHSKPSMLSIEPRYHEQLGLTHYAKVTSPLRRYGDMVTHWQIEGAIRAEAEANAKAAIGLGEGNSVSESRQLPFSADEVQQMMTTLSTRETRIKRITRQSEEFWISMLLFRAHYFGEASLPEKLTAYVVVKPFAVSAGCVIRELGINARVTPPDGELSTDVFRVGDEWEATVAAIVPFQASVYVKAVRLLKRIEES